MHLLERWDFEFTIKANKKILFWSKKQNIILRYKQANIAQVQEFFKFKNNQDWFVYFLKEHWLKEKQINRILISKEYYNIFNKIKNTYFRKVFEEKKILENDVKKFKIKHKLSEDEESSFICTVCKESWLNPATYMQDLTLEQFNFISKWVIWNINSQTKEWQKRNKQNILENKTPEEDEETKKLIALINKIPD